MRQVPKLHTACGVALLLIAAGLGACGGDPTAEPLTSVDAVATEVALQRAVAATLTADAEIPAAAMVETQVAVARAAAATLTAEAPKATLTPTPPTVLEEMGARNLGDGFRLLMQESKDDGQLDYGYHFWVPLLVGPEEPVTEGFNRAVDGFTTYALDEFRQWISSGVDEPGSTIWMTHTVTYGTEDLISVLFYVDGYVMGAAHPFHYSHSMNYDTAAVRMLELEDLFRPGTDYLGVLSQYSLDDLERQGVLEWEEGALPQAENFQRWNITPQGLLISFDEYLVAPYAAGPQEVLIPYRVLAPVADLEGPLAPFLP
jgi:hypothetical protein